MSKNQLLKHSGYLVKVSVSSELSHLVDLMMAYSKRSDLCEELGQVVHALDSKQIEYGNTVSRSVANGHAPRVWRVRDRLAAEEIEWLIRSYREGATGQELAQRFGIGLSSVKKLIRQSGVRKTVTSTLRYL